MTNYYPHISKTKYTEKEGRLGDLMHVCMCAYGGEIIISFIAHMPQINLKQEEYCARDHFLKC